MLIEKSYTIDATQLQHLIMDDLYSMLYHHHEMLKNLPQGVEEWEFRHYMGNRTTLIRMLNLQGMNKKEYRMVMGYLEDLEDAILNGTYKMR